MNKKLYESYTTQINTTARTVQVGECEGTEPEERGEGRKKKEGREREREREREVRGEGEESEMK